MTEVAIRTLNECEGVIKQGMDTFVQVGTALAEIRDNRLYKDAGFTSFETYCQERWGWNRSYANKQIRAAEVALEVGTVVPTPLTSERQARAIAPVLKEHGVEVAAQVLQDAAAVGLTAKSIEQTAQRAIATRLQAERQRQKQADEVNVILANEQTRSELDDLIDRLDRGESVVVNMRDPLSRALDARGYLVRIDRGSVWGNPFILSDDGTRDQVIDAYAQHYLPFKPSLHERLNDLRGMALGCWCAPEPCHGQALLTLLGGES